MRLCRRSPPCSSLAARVGGADGNRVRAAELRSWRGVPVRLEPRSDRHGGRDDDGEGRARQAFPQPDVLRGGLRSEEHTSELQSLMRISYAVFCLKKKKDITTTTEK